ncbi:hypothetical protein H5U35_02330, partial [Candidatus Aerophobetes bacterium]|nr:hypothetical protein [Candidatus Aerophobetes bacterium]
MKKSKPMSRVITEEEFSQKLQKRAQRIFSMGNVLLKKKDLEQIYYSNLQAEAHALETFLDNHKARGNKKFSYFTELVACIRWIANAIYTIKHIQNRFKNYNLEENEKLFQSMDNFIIFCNKIL